jgi:hypothetical protein
MGRLFAASGNLLLLVPKSSLLSTLCKCYLALLNSFLDSWHACFCHWIALESFASYSSVLTQQAPVAPSSSKPGSKVQLRSEAAASLGTPRVLL